jgi:Fe2+ or Zn2+ uptake regulation protein
VVAGPGVVRHTHFHDGVAQFERTDEAPHHYMVCSRCGSDFELVRQRPEHFEVEFWLICSYEAWPPKSGLKFP